MEKRVIDIRGLCSQAMRRYGIYLILLLIVAAGSVMSPVFLTAKNIMSVGRQVSVTGILAFAETILIIGGNVDLSLGSQVALSGMISINTYLATGSAAAAFASGYFAVRVMLKLIAKANFKWFSLYLVVVAVGCFFGYFL